MSEETKEVVVEKRVKSTVIRRRSKTVTVEAKAEKVEPAEKTTAEAQAVKAVESEKAQSEAAAAKAAEKKAKPIYSPAPEPELKIVEDDKAKKGSRKASRKKSKAELDMEEINRVGGLKKFATIVGKEDPGGEETSNAAPAERIFEPVRTGKRRRNVSQREFKKTAKTTPKAIKRVIHIDGSIAIVDLAKKMGVRSSDIVRKLMDMGSMVTANESIDLDTVEVVAQDYDFTVENVSFKEESVLETRKSDPQKMKTRAPVVTVMGHVDHGKTSILDAIRKTSVADGEAGGITQHIGAYQAVTSKGKVTFIDTPGHEAFTTMRARGAQVTDLVILVVAADDGVMPQTAEAINHAKDAGVPMIVAVNKVDKPEANLDKVRNELSEKGVISEEWGGDTIFVNVSAKTGEGLDTLLEMIVLQAEVLELKGDPSGPALGNVIEVKLDKGRGVVATVLVREGTLKRSDHVVIGNFSGRIRAMTNDKGQIVKEAGPSMPVEIIGLDGVPEPGSTLYVVKNEDEAKKVSEYRQQKQRTVKMGPQTSMKLEDLFAQVEAGKIQELKVVLKADTQGSLEAVKQAIQKIGNEQVQVNVIHDAVGGINESDVMLAHSGQAIILGFNIRPDTKARQLAESESVEVKLYRVIYELTEDIAKALTGMLKPTYEEVYFGRAEVREVFNVSKVGAVAGCTVIDGKIVPSLNVRLLRDEKVVYEGKMASLKRFKDDTKEVVKGFECGLGLENFNDIKVNDTIEAFQINEIQQTL